jgi:hypothetical protein
VVEHQVLGQLTATEEYNGTSWAASPPGLNTARRALGTGCGTQTAGLAFGGNSPITGATEEYNGTSWATSPGSLNTARRSLRGAGYANSSFRFWWYC